MALCGALRRLDVFALEDLKGAEGSACSGVSALYFAGAVALLCALRRLERQPGMDGLTGADVKFACKVVGLLDLTEVWHVVRRTTGCHDMHARQAEQKRAKVNLGMASKRPRAEAVLATRCAKGIDISTCGPGSAARKVRVHSACGGTACGQRAWQVLKSFHCDEDRAEWLAEARTLAICGSCPKSAESVFSGIRQWRWFAKNVLRISGTPLPPTIDGLLQWSLTFRNNRTFANYVGYVRLACELEGKPLDVFRHSSLARAKEAIKKRRLVARRPATFVGLALLQQLVPLMLHRPVMREMLMLFLAAYIFLLRVPSEGLPLAVHENTDNDEVPVFVIGAGFVSMWFPFRKNVLEPTRLVRKCWCRKCPVTCPVHILGHYMASLPIGARPFACFRPSQVLLAVRESLAQVGVTGAEAYGTHSFRRGHAEDLRAAGGTLADILAAGGWKSAAFQCYLDREKLECARLAEAMQAASDSDDSD